MKPLRNLWLEAWGRRRELGGLWWRGLGAAGLDRDRFHALPAWQSFEYVHAAPACVTVKV